MIVEDHFQQTSDHHHGADRSHLNYYRLGAYWLPYEQDHATHQFEAGTSFRRVLDHYIFDRELRLLVLDAIERIEVSVRSNWAHHVGTLHGAHAHLNMHLFVDVDKWNKHIERLKEEVERSSETFIVHFRNKYIEELPPIWAVCEVMSMGSLSKWYRNFGPAATKKLISSVYGVDQRVLASWLHHLSVIREVTVTPMIPTSNRISPHYEMSSTSRGIYNTLVLLDYMLTKISPDHGWRSRLVALIREYQIDPVSMGFPSGPCRLLRD